MIASLRRISGLLLALSLLTLTTATTYQLGVLCSNGQPNCLMAAVTFGVPDSPIPFMVDTSLPESSVAISPDEPSTSGILFDLIQMSSIYLILVSVLIIVVLEFFELRYLRQLTKAKRA